MNRLRYLLASLFISLSAVVWLVSVGSAGAQGVLSYQIVIPQSVSEYEDGTASGSATFDVPNMSYSAPAVGSGSYLNVGFYVDLTAHSIPTTSVKGFAYRVEYTAQANQIEVAHYPGNYAINSPMGWDASGDYWACAVVEGWNVPAWCNRYRVINDADELTRIHFKWTSNRAPGTADYGEFRVLYDSAYTPSNPAPPFSTSCVVTYTETITNNEGITTTQTISYTVEDANLIENPSFEEQTTNNGFFYPEHWRPVIGGVEDWSIGDITSNGSNTGDYALYNKADFELWGSPDRVLSNRLYLAGYYGRCATSIISCTENLVHLEAGFQSVSTTYLSPINGEYSVYSGTVSLGGGSPNIVLDFTESLGDPVVLVDDVFLLPWDETNGLDCTSDLYPPDEYNTEPIGEIPGPIGGAGSICYQCTTPGNLAASTVSYWIAWLGCVIRNMFSCSLRVWLLVLGNWLRGLVNYTKAWAIWAPLTVQQGADWFNSYVLPAISSISVNVVNSGTNFWDVLIAIIELLGTLLSLISSLALGIVEFIIEIMAMLPQALTADPRYITINGQEFTEGSTLDISGDGGSTDKIIYLFLMGIGFVDTIVFTNASVNTTMFVVLGAVSFVALLWGVNQWADLIKF